MPSGHVGGVRIGVAFNDGPLEANPTFTYLTDHPNLVAGYTIDRQVDDDSGRANAAKSEITIIDPGGILDPTNTTGLYYGLIEPTLQVQIELRNPINDTCYSRFRGNIFDLNYDVHPSQLVTALSIDCVGIFTAITKIEMQPGEFGDTPPTANDGTIFYDNANVDDRILQALADAGIPPEMYVVFSGNVSLYEGIYSPGQNPLDVIFEAADGEFPCDVSSVYEDRFGRLVFHGRLAKFDPAGTAAGATPGAWDFTHWKCGDHAAVALSPSDTAQIRALSFNRGWGKIINSALATPKGIAAAAVAGQLVKDIVSIGLRGICSWSRQELLTESGTLTGNNANDETKLFSEFLVANRAQPRNRITALTFKSMHPDWAGAAATWDLLCRADISDLIDVTETHGGGGGFNAEPFFIDGIHEEVEPLNTEYALVTLNLTVSPQDYFTDPAGLDGV